MSDESPESLRYTAAQDRKAAVGEKEEEKEKKTLLIMTKLDAVKGWSASGATQEDFVQDWNATTETEPRDAVPPPESMQIPGI